MTEPTVDAGWTSRRSCERLNRMLAGWANYFCLGPVSKAYRPWTATRGIGSVSGCAEAQGAGSGDVTLVFRQLRRGF